MVRGPGGLCKGRALPAELSARVRILPNLRAAVNDRSGRCASNCASSHLL
jgi:hypothetical protein